MSRYTVTSTHELTPSELERAPKGLKRSSIEVHFSKRKEAIEEYEYKLCFLQRLGFSDRLELRDCDRILACNQA